MASTELAMLGNVVPYADSKNEKLTLLFFLLLVYESFILLPECPVLSLFRIVCLQFSPFSLLFSISLHMEIIISIYFLYHNLVILVFIIFFCNWKTPYIKASAVGGQPGT